MSLDCIKFRVLYTADIRKKGKKWQDGTISVSLDEEKQTKLIKLFGQSPSELGEDSWDYENEKQRKGYHLSPFLQSFKPTQKHIELGQELSTGRYLITVEEQIRNDENETEVIPQKNAENLSPNLLEHRKALPKKVFHNTDVFKGNKRRKEEPETIQNSECTLFTENLAQIEDNITKDILPVEEKQNPCSNLNPTRRTNEEIKKFLKSRHQC